ncbi:MAG: Rpn family recombination-promoting nuclease/putative transposase [Candidatus Cryptobacteroides sp.]
MEKEMRKKASGRYADVVSDAGFKAVFCDKNNKDVVRDFINVILPPERRVVSFKLMRTELPGKTDRSKTIRIDLRCVTVDGTEIIIEMQNYKQQHFFRRCLYYTSKVYESNLKAGKKKGKVLEYNVPPVYMIVLLNVPNKHLVEPEDKDKYVFEYTFREKDTLEVPDETINIIFVELSRFAKPLSGCANAVDKWCYALKHIGGMESKPEELANEEIDRLFRRRK